MTENTDIEAEPKSPAQAFEDLRREVAFMRKVIERMADDQRAVPDYSETLGTMADSLTTASKSLGWLTQRPIVKTTAEQMAHEISKAGNQARATDQRTIADAATALNDTNRDLSAWIAIARKADEQDREVLRFSAIAAGAGALIAIMLMIACFRLFPEQGAAWLLGADRWNARQHLMASVDSQKWTSFLQTLALYNDNQRVIADCQEKANLSQQDQRCRVIVKTFKPEQ
jgi:hypothetical protein